MIVAATGEPAAPVDGICALTEGAAAITAAANIPLRKMLLFGFIVFAKKNNTSTADLTARR
jgi:hypothetical protein